MTAIAIIFGSIGAVVMAVLVEALAGAFAWLISLDGVRGSTKFNGIALKVFATGTVLAALVLSYDFEGFPVLAFVGLIALVGIWSYPPKQHGGA